jgi:hypothetical protein
MIKKFTMLSSCLLAFITGILAMNFYDGLEKNDPLFHRCDKVAEVYIYEQMEY